MTKLKGWVVRNPWAAVFWACAIFWVVVAAIVVLVVLV
ncbi:Uncharacterised protein [Serratia quinivorans]|nr:Uncharacterised protein [Serratia quinivorans]